MRGFLAECRFVNGVEPDALGFNKRKSVFLVRYAEAPSLLAKSISLLPELEVLSASDAAIEVRVKPAQGR